MQSFPFSISLFPPSRLVATPFPGLYVLKVTAKVDGKKFDDVRHTATLRFEVPH